MPEEKNESSGFKVVDRRSFSNAGVRREGDAEEEKPSAPPPPSPAASTAPPEMGDEPTGEEVGEMEPTGFETIVSYLSTTAMFQLGLLAGPGGQRIPPDLVNARATIDMLEVLQEKTRGNLTGDESQLLEEVLYELRMSYVAVQQKYRQKPR